MSISETPYGRVKYDMVRWHLLTFKTGFKVKFLLLFQLDSFGKPSNNNEWIQLSCFFQKFWKSNTKYKKVFRPFLSDHSWWVNWFFVKTHYDIISVRTNQPSDWLDCEVAERNHHVIYLFLCGNVIVLHFIIWLHCAL